MAYKRFLVDTDYLPVLTEEHMRQLVRSVHDRIPLAEQSAEMNMLEFLDQYYEIENELKKGKSIAEYSPLVTYPAGVYFKYEEKIYKTVTTISGRKIPTTDEYWTIADSLTLQGIYEGNIKQYSQLKNYLKGDLARYGSNVYECCKNHGLELNNVRIPGISAWTVVTADEWEKFYEYSVGDVVAFGGDFYTLLSIENVDWGMEPLESDNWGLIAEYSDDYEYGYGEESTDYVVHDGMVFKAVINPNAVKPEMGVNIIADDPRNINVITHMVRLSVYYLHQLISPTNISETRRIAYEDTMNWLMMASKFKLNPQIPRKINKEDGRATTDWAIETYQREFNPRNDPWLI